jgi:uncharacterized protein YodC (DUF2158 family)
MKMGDKVKEKGEGPIMTVERIQSDIVYCVYKTEKKKVFKFRFWERDLELINEN